jgi:hypothetical protein
MPLGKNDKSSVDIVVLANNEIARRLRWSDGKLVVVDIFLSYSREDRDRARQIAEALAAEKFTVWWDHEIPTGRDFQQVIEERISDASCVVVLWSTTSVESRWVRSEASEGDERGILLPIKIEAVRLPLAFKLVQTEDFNGWEGDKEAECWKRLVLQIGAMIGTKSSTLSGQTFTSQTFTPFQPYSYRNNPRPSGGLLAISGFAALWLASNWTPKVFSGILAVTIGIAAVVFLLFRMVESDVTPRVRALAAQWLLPRVGGARVEPSEALNHFFDAVFGSEHFTAYCFVRATVASAVFLAIVLLLIRFVLGATVIFDIGTWISLLFYAGAVNILGNYSALYVTRVMLRLYRNGMNIGLVVLSDFILKLAIFVATIGLAILVIYSLNVLNGHLSVLQGMNWGEAIFHNLTRVVRQPYLDLYGPHSPDLLPPGQRRLLYASAVTTFVTSIWLWVALLLSPLFRLLVWASGTGLTLIGFIFDVQNAPFAALAYLGSLIVLTIGGTIWGVSECVAALHHGGPS